MTALRVSQLASINVLGGVSSGLRFSQVLAIVVGNPPMALGLRFSQLFAIAVVANGQMVQSLGPIVPLNCWTPCGTLIWNGS